MFKYTLKMSFKYNDTKIYCNDYIMCYESNRDSN